MGHLLECIRNRRDAKEEEKGEKEQMSRGARETPVLFEGILSNDILTRKILSKHVFNKAT